MRRILVLAALLAITTTMATTTALTGAAPVAAQTYGPSDGELEVTPATVAPGGEVTVSGDGFAPGEPARVVISYVDADGATVEIEVATAAADDDGRVTATFTVPADARGTVTIRLLGTAPDGASRVLSGSVAVRAPGGGSNPPGSGGGNQGNSGNGGNGNGGDGGTLARTGTPSRTPQIVATGLALVVAGGVVVVLTARRRASAR